MLTAVAAAATLAALLSSPAFAQTAPAPGEAEKLHAVGSLSLATIRVSVEKASDPMVKEFAKWEVAEQETIADILKSMEMDGKAEGALKPPSQDEVEKMLDPEGKGIPRQAEGRARARVRQGLRHGTAGRPQEASDFPERVPEGRPEPRTFERDKAGPRPDQGTSRPPRHAEVKAWLMVRFGDHGCTGTEPLERLEISLRPFRRAWTLGS